MMKVNEKSGEQQQSSFHLRHMRAGALRSKRLFLGLGSLLICGALVQSAVAQSVVSTQKDSSGATLKTDSGSLRLQLYTDRSVRVIHTTNDKSASLDSLVLDDGQAVPFKLNEQGDAVVLSTAKMSVKVDK